MFINMPFRRESIEDDSGKRKIGYTVVEPPLVDGDGGDDSSPKSAKSSTAILYFYPLSGCSEQLVHIASAVKDYKCKMICVDRPSCSVTSPLLLEKLSCSEEQQLGETMARIEGHAEDVLLVLKKEQIDTVYILAVCIGYAYAMKVCLRLLDDGHASSSTTTPTLAGLTLIAPFVSTACPNSWRVARLGASVPSCLLYSSTEVISCFMSSLLPVSMRPSLLQSLITPEEQEEFGWTQDDFEKACEIGKMMNSKTKDCTAVEARVGADPGWQQVCDQFAIQSGCGLREDDNKEDTSTPTPASQPKLPIRIYACPHDKLVSVEAIEWISDRCFRGGQVCWQDKIHSHEHMTFLGGPTHNPTLLHKAVEEWGLR